MVNQSKYHIDYSSISLDYCLYSIFAIEINNHPTGGYCKGSEICW